jgi:hypothetical protein
MQQDDFDDEFNPQVDDIEAAAPADE